MSKSTRARTREKNPNWKGGRTIASTGYVLIKVGFDHHLAAVNGYAYEHRLVAEKILGRRLRPGELVHHINGIKTDNRPENIEVCKSIAHHYLRHRKQSSNRRLPDEENKQLDCACGCGERFLKFDKSGRPRKFITGHNMYVNPRGKANVG